MRIKKKEMDRVIKFRLYDKRSDRFLYASWGDLHNDDVNSGREYYPLEFAVGFKGNHENELSKPMQFTGLLDLDGKECYEGDIIESYPKQDVRFLITFGKSKDSGTYGWCLESRKKGREVKVYSMDDTPNKMRIIGNVFEQPDLL